MTLFNNFTYFRIVKSPVAHGVFRMVIITRGMQSSRGFLGQQTSYLLRRQSYPPVNLRSYKAVRYVDPQNLRTDTNGALTKHETSHTMIVNDEMDLSLGVLTSMKKPKPGITPIVIDSTNFKGENKQQSVAAFQRPRSLSIGIVQEDPQITQYIVNKEAMLDQILSTVKKIEPIGIVHKTHFDSPKDEEIFTK